MTGVIVAVTDLFDYNPPRVYDFSSCSEYAKADQEYMSNKISNMALLIGLVFGVGGFYENPSNALNLRMRAVHSIFGGAIFPVAVKILSYLTEDFHVVVSKNMCEESAADFPDFQTFAESVKNLYQNKNPKS